MICASRSADTVAGGVVVVGVGVGVGSSGSILVSVTTGLANGFSAGVDFCVSVDVGSTSNGLPNGLKASFVSSGVATLVRAATDDDDLVGAVNDDDDDDDLLSSASSRTLSFPTSFPALS